MRCFFFRARDSSIDCRNSVESEHVLGLNFGQNRAPTLTNSLENQAHSFLRRPTFFGPFCQTRSLVKSAEVVAVAPHVAKRASRRIRIRKSGNARFIESRNARGYELSTHPTDEHWFSETSRVWFEGLCYGGRIRHTLRREDGKQTIAVRIANGDVEGTRVFRGAGVPKDVDRIGMTPVRRKESAEGFERRIRKGREFTAIAQ